MPRLFLPFISTDLSSGAVITVTGDEARYLNNVLRMRRGDTLTVFGPEGTSADTRISGVRKGEVKLEVLVVLPARRNTENGIILVQGLLKKSSKMDLVIEKATELGVSAIVPVITQRSQLKKTGKLERWRKIALEAARQSGRTSTPDIHEPLEFMKFIAGAEGKMDGFIFYEEESRDISSDDALAPEGLHVMIGPEGGFLPEEVDAAKEAGLEARGLGTNILRSETAAIAALAIVGFLSGEISQQ